MDSLHTLAAEWRERAELLARHGAGEAAATLRTVADELEGTVQAAEDKILTLAEAVEESGYSERRLRELITDGTIPNAGRKGAPRVRRADLPRRARAQAQAGGYDPSADARALLSRLG